MPANALALAPGPVAGIDYPRDLTEFHEFFGSDEVCRTHLERLRWPGGFVCPACGVLEEPYRMVRGRLLCRSCRHQTSVTAGTIFEGTRKPLQLWFHTAWLITSQKSGASALHVQRMLGVRSYETAWSWVHKYRRAMVRPGRDRLSGIVEVDETYVGGLEEGVVGRETETKALVAIAVEMNLDAGPPTDATAGPSTDGRAATVRKHRMGRVRLAVIPNARRATLHTFLRQTVEPGSVVMTDAWRAYQGMETLGYAHHVTNIAAGSDPAHVVMPGVHRVASLLKRWLLGTLQGSASREHLPYYLDEFTFRFNRRTSASPGLLFHRLLTQAVQAPHITTDAMFLGTGRGRAQHGRRSRRTSADAPVPVDRPAPARHR